MTVYNGDDSCSDNANANQDVSKEPQYETNNLEKVKSENGESWNASKAFISLK